MSARREGDRAQVQAAVAEPLPRRPSSATAWRRPRLHQLLLGPGWMPSVVIALLAGGLGGVLPVAVLGEPGQGLLAGLVNGFAAAATLGPVWMPPLVATVVCAEVESGVSAYRWVSGISAAALRNRRRVEALSAVVAALAAAAAMGVVGAVLANVSTPGDWSVGLAGSSGSSGFGFAIAAAAVSVTLSISVAELVGRRLLAVVILEGSLMATAAVLAMLYFAPILKPAQVLSPWVGIWPLRAADARSPLLATDIEPWIAHIATAAWVLALLTAALLRRPDQLPKGTE